MLASARGENKGDRRGDHRVTKHAPVRANARRGAKTGGITTQEAKLMLDRARWWSWTAKSCLLGWLPPRRRDRPQRPRCALVPERTCDDVHHQRPRRQRSSPRLKTRYRDEIRAGAENGVPVRQRHADPWLVEVVVDMGVGEAARDAKLIEGAYGTWPPSPVRSRWSARPQDIAQFKLRKGMPIGARSRCGRPMCEFLDGCHRRAAPYP